MSDGTEDIYVIDPVEWVVKQQIKVHNEDGTTVVSNLNEIEVVENKWIFAN